MEFLFEEQQLAFRDAVHKFLMVEASPEMLREIWETDTGRSADLRAKIADQGLTAISVPEAHGGIGGGDLDWVLVQQELGYFAIPDSLTATAYLATWLLSQLPDSAPQKKEWLPKVASGKARIALGHPINPMVADAGNAGLLLLAQDDEVHAITPGAARLTANRSIDQSRRLSKVNWKPNGETRLADARSGAKLWAGVIDRAGLAIAAQHVGLAQRMLDLGVDHSAQRKQFGKPIGSFQAVKHHLAEVAVAIEFAEPVVHRAAYALARGDSRAPLYVSHARLAASDAAQLAARKSLQVHGAMGYTWEADLQMFMKRAWALDATWGDRAFHKMRIADGILAEGAAIGPGATFARAATNEPSLRLVAAK